MWLNQLINFIQPQTIMLSCPLWAAVINCRVSAVVRESGGSVPKSCSCIRLHFMSLYISHKGNIQKNCVYKIFSLRFGCIPVRQR